MRTLIKETPLLVGQKVTLMGWVDVRRDHGKIIFIDLRDRSGVIQVVFIPSNKSTYDTANQLRSEWVVKIEGVVNARPEKMINPNLLTGKVEILAETAEVLNKSETLPIAIDTDGHEIGEEARMIHKYVDLKRSRLQRNIKTRSIINQFIRNYLSNRDFIEVETPILSKSTPEGARDYLVPSRLYPGKFFALPQSPQQYKQLLMVTGLERYFQIARCFRDEDTRGDRQPEFTQLDIEISFTNEDEVRTIMSEMIRELVTQFFPKKKFSWPIPIMTYKEVMEKYNSDKPDLRNDKNNPDELAFLWVVDFPFFEKTDGGGYTFTHNPFSAPKPEHMEWLLKKDNVGEIKTAQYDLVLNGYEIGGGSIRNHQPEALKAVFQILGLPDEKIEENFGHMLKALSLGAPPHGGIAFGLDRIFAILFNEPNIREVIAFPKTGDARDLMMGAPSFVVKEQLDELGIQIKNKK